MYSFIPKAVKKVNLKQEKEEKTQNISTLL